MFNKYGMVKLIQLTVASSAKVLYLILTLTLSKVANGK